ncbi:MAG: sigma 54-interacting transcriptional regulator [Desulfatitalea sp.]|nr:sigma 54-interacting transcriptional regulator [Desulfatitalea sp.]
MDPNTFFREAMGRLFGRGEIEIAMQELLNYLKQVMPADRLHLNHYHRELKALRVLVVATLQEALRTRIIYPLDEEGSTYLEDPMITPFEIVNKFGDHPVDRSLSRKSGLFMDHSGMVVHLRRQEGMHGSLVLFAEGNYRFSKHHLDRIAMLKEPFETLLKNALRDEEMNQMKDILNQDLRHPDAKLDSTAADQIVGRNFGLRQVMEMVTEVAPMNSPVLLLGETGVGKEVIAHAIHQLSDRSQGPFIPINSGAIPEGLMDSELFGHERGAFTGAASRKEGYFQLADGGTIFLDEIGELTPQAQVRLLRVLQEKTIQPVGGKGMTQVDVRIIAATHRDLQEMILRGRFRSDLWFRLHVFPVVIPSLRDRKEDIPALLTHFIEKKRLALNLTATPRLAPGTLELLLGYDWPGNVRELENMVERALILAKDGFLSFHPLIPQANKSESLEISEPTEAFSSLDDHMAEYIRRVLRKTKGRIEGSGGAAEILRINPGTLRNRMKKYGILFRKKEIRW